MTFYVENETTYTFPFPLEELLEQVAMGVLEKEACPYPVCVNLMITDGEGIRSYNQEYRHIDKETDVLSFPGVDFDAPADFGRVEENEADYFDPETKELLLGDMIINYEQAIEQAKNYGHSLKREVAFLIAHSMYHLCGYDHMEPDEAEVMEAKQEEVLTQIGITRE